MVARLIGVLMAAAMFGAALAPAPSGAQSARGLPSEAVAMLERVVAMDEAEGHDATMAAILDQNYADFHDRDLYPFVLNRDGVMQANGANPSITGIDMIHWRDAAGEMFVAEMVAAPADSDGVWIDYLWRNPTNDAVEPNSSFVRP